MRILIVFDLMLPGVPNPEALRRFRESLDRIVKTPAVLEQALRLVLANGVYVPPSVLRRHDAARPAEAPAPLRSLSDLGLTPRQQEVCALMVKGRTVKQIACELDIASATVKAHLQPILRAIGATSRTEAIVALHRLGYSLQG